MNPRIFRIKEKTLRYNFSIQHCPGKWQRGADAISRSHSSQAFINAFNLVTRSEDSDVGYSEALVELATLASLSDFKDAHTISPDMIRLEAQKDTSYKILMETVFEGFPASRHLTKPEIRGYWEVRDKLYAENSIILMDGRTVIPHSLRGKVLKALHSAHQAVVGMKARANESVYWPGMDTAIRHHYASCVACSRIAPSQPKEPLILTPSPDWPFQQVVMDLFHIESSTYLACADRLTGWLILYHLDPLASSSKVISICRELFQTYGVFEELSTDGGPQFTSEAFKQFLRNWNVKHRLSSVAYPQSNGRAELAVKTAKRLIMSNTGPRGSLNTDKVVQAVLQYRNTPIQNIGLSPAQLLLHRHLRDSIPQKRALYKPHAEWIQAAEVREQLLSKRNEKLAEQYNQHTRNLLPLTIGDSITVQNNVTRRWDLTGKIVECLPGRQYTIRIDGSGRITLRNRRFLRKINFPIPSYPIPSAWVPTPHVPTPHDTQPDQQPITLPVTNNRDIDTNITIGNKLPRALARLATYNNPGARDIGPPPIGLPAKRGGGGARGDIE